ncbi:MAG: chromosomal replication initiator protein DnaA [Desulfocapsaceae bacterium]|nr:chromosomal replication initiator protein DnaA [Desulfocapsaceae bacterium]
MVWDKARQVLHEELSDNVFSLWIEPLSCVQAEGDTIRLACPDRFFSAYIARNYLELIQEKVNETDPLKRKVVLCETPLKPIALPVIKGEPLRLPHIPTGGSCVRSLHPRYTFDEFMVGESNLLAQSACRSISANDDCIGPCLYINSGTGLGKSHLTQAVAHQILSTSPMTRLHYVTAQQFSLEMVRDIKANTMDRFKRKYHDQCDILLLEDVHALTGKKKTQEELNEILDYLIKTGKRVVLTANSSPRDLVGIDGEFRSRMASGLVTTIQAPDLTTRQMIFGNKVRYHQLHLSEEHIAYLAQHIKGDVRQIESAIIALRAKAQLMARSVDMDLLEEVVMSVVGQPKTVSAKMIGEFVSSQFRVSVEDMQSRSRKKSLTLPRQVAMYLCRKHTDETLADIGKAFNRDHSTVLHSIKVVTALTNRDTSAQEQVRLLSSRIQRF